MKGIIYCYHNIITGKKYIGQTINPEQRYKQHTQYDIKFQDKFHTAMREYGVESFVYGVIEECRREKLDKRETYWIKKYKTHTEGYNGTPGGKGGIRKKKNRFEGLIVERRTYNTNNNSTGIPCLISFMWKDNLYVEDIETWSMLNGYSLSQLKKLAIPTITEHKDIVGIEWNWKR